MGYRPNYEKGTYKAICDVCGKEFKAYELKKRWDGFLVDSLCWEPRHPQDFVRGVADTQAPVWTRPEPSDIFVPINYTPYITDVLSLQEKITKSIQKNLAGESLSLAENVVPLLISLRSFSESLSLSENISFSTQTQGVTGINVSSLNANCLG